jgi:hypothetical protein
MAMSDRALKRNIGRIPRLSFLIRKAGKAGQSDRVAGFEQELKRRRYEMLAAGQDDLLKVLLKIKLDSAANKDSARLKALQAKY